jgi:hypothetical protein
VGKVALLGGLLLLAAGCVHPQNTEELEPDSTPAAAPEPVVSREVEIGADDSDEAPDSPPPVSAGRAPVLVWSEVRLPAEPVLFRLGAGLGALGHIDLGSCRDQGLPPGYVHMHLTFRHTGHVVRAAVETPIAPPPEALACIGEQIESTMVPVFDGGAVSLSKSVYVN